MMSKYTYTYFELTLKKETVAVNATPQDSPSAKRFVRDKATEIILA